MMGAAILSLSMEAQATESWLDMVTSEELLAKDYKNVRTKPIEIKEIENISKGIASFNFDNDSLMMALDQLIEETHEQVIKVTNEQVIKETQVLKINNNPLYDFTFQNLKDGSDIPLSQYSNQVIMIVNTASKCQLSSQLMPLNEIHKKYSSSGLVIIGIPSNSFGGLEPGNTEDVAKVYENLGVNFIMTQPVVIGRQESHDFYKWAGKRDPFWANTHPKWNFHKYLFGKDGKPVVSFQHLIKPDDAVVKHWIEDALYGEPK